MNALIKERILRVEGRLSNAFVEYDTGHPFVVPGWSHFTELVMKNL